MGANAGTAVPVYASGEVLTAARLNLTNCGVPVFSGTATRDAAFGGSGEKVLAEGQLAYLEDADVVQYYTGAAWATVGPVPAPGLELVKTQTIGSTVSSVTVTDAFSATYDKYLITVTGGAGSISAGGSIQFGATNTGYYWAANYVAYTGGSGVFSGANDTAFKESFYGSAAALAFCMEVTNPFAAKETLVSWRHGGAATLTVNLHVVGNGFLNNTTSYTAFTITPTGGTYTGGTIRVYGYRN